MAERTCVIEGCGKPARSMSADWCKMHYHRWYRHGDVTVVSHGVSTRINDSEYRRIRAVGHPVATGSGTAWEHRVVLFDHIGNGPHGCHWCSRPVSWWLRKGHPNKLTVDHLNEVRDDNRPSNLVPSCGDCNADRGSAGRARRLRERGWWSQNDTVASLKKVGRKDRAA